MLPKPQKIPPSAHDDNRVFFTFGRDIRLSPLQKGGPLNYFIYPYAELDGKPFSALQSHFSFRDIAPTGATASTGNTASR
jgi:hypothetical protein